MVPLAARRYRRRICGLLRRWTGTGDCP